MGNSNEYSRRYHETHNALAALRDIPTTNPAYLKAVGAPVEVHQELNTIEEHLASVASELSMKAKSSVYVAHVLHGLARTFEAPMPEFET